MDEIKLFSKGDWVVHVNYGVGQIKGLEKKSFNGKDSIYYRVENDDCTFWIQVNNTNNSRVRPVVTKKGLQKAIYAIKDDPNEVDSNHKARESWIKEIRRDCSLQSTACLVRDLACHDMEKRLSPREQDTLEDLKKQLATEWSVVSDIPVKEAKNRLEKLIAQHSQ